MNSTAQFQHSFHSIARTSESVQTSESRATASFANTLATNAERLEADEATVTESAGRLVAKAKRPQLPGVELLLRAWSWFTKNRAFGAEKQLRISETLSLGEKRFVALLHVDGRKFLIGGGASGVSLLTRLEPVAGAIEGVPTGTGEQSR